MEQNEKAGEQKQAKKKKSGLGVLCSQAQADGIPCEELDFDCEHCDHADWKDDQAAEDA